MHTIMKKTYMTPATEVVKIERQLLLDSSVTLYNQNAQGDGLAPAMNVDF